MKAQHRVPTVDKLREELEERQRATNDFLESNLAQALLQGAMPPDDEVPPTGNNPTLAALLAVTTPTIGADYRTMIAELYYQTEVVSGKGRQGEGQSLSSKVANCLDRALDNAQELHNRVQKAYTSDLAEQVERLCKHSQHTPSAILPQLQGAINLAHTAYQVSNHPEQDCETRHASRYAAATREYIALTQALIQAYNRSVGIRPINLNGNAATAAVHGKFLFHQRIREKVKDLHGHFVVIDVRTGDYETSPTQADAHRELRKRKPQAFCWVERVGSPDPYEPEPQGNG